MPTLTSQADIALDWRGLIDATDKNPDLLPIVQGERDALEQFLETFGTLKATQDELTAMRQEVTQKLLATLAQGKEVAIRIRSVVRGKIGPRSERLAQFKVPPIRSRPRKPVVELPPPGGEEVGTKPGASVSPSTKPVV